AESMKSRKSCGLIRALVPIFVRRSFPCRTKLSIERGQQPSNSAAWRFVSRGSILALRWLRPGAVEKELVIRYSSISSYSLSSSPIARIAGPRHTYAAQLLPNSLLKPLYTRPCGHLQLWGTDG